MTNFEKITQSPEALGNFLASLPVPDGPWDAEFRRRYCGRCRKLNCDDGNGCRHESRRGSPVWWLRSETQDGDEPPVERREREVKEKMKQFSEEEWELHNAVMDVVNERGADMSTETVCDVLRVLCDALAARAKTTRMKDFAILTKAREAEQRAGRE